MNAEVTLFDRDIRELAWVADVLEHPEVNDYGLNPQERRDLAGVIRSKLPTYDLESTYTVYDRNGAEYKNFDGKWYLVQDGYALEVPYESIQDPATLRLKVVK